MRDVKPYRTKQILNSRGNIEVKVKITDFKGNTSVQLGYSNSSNIKAHFKQVYNEAVLNAVYKHFWNNGGYYINSRDYNIADLCESIVILNHEVIYFSDLNYYTFKRVTREGKYYTLTRRKGKFYSYEPYNSIDKEKLNTEYNFKESKKTKAKTGKVLKTEKREGKDRTFYENPLQEHTNKDLIKTSKKQKGKKKNESSRKKTKT